MDVMSVYSLLEDEADDELLLLVHLFRDESDEMYSERNREGCFNTLVQRRLIDSELDLENILGYRLSCLTIF